MKTKFKRITALFVALLTFAFSVATVNAQCRDKNSLQSACRHYAHILTPTVPYEGPYYSDESTNNLRSIINENNELISRANKGEKIPPEMYEEGYNKMVQAAENLHMHKRELEFIIDINKSQKNSDNYFDDEMWNEYQENILKAEEALESDDPNTIDEWYYKMLYQHNKLCVYNLTLGDVNGDGVFNVDDVTYYQRKLADNSDCFNYSQILVSLMTYRDDESKPSIDIATSMQKKLSGLLINGANPPVIQYNSSFTTRCDSERYDYYIGTFYNNALYERHRIENPWLYGEYEEEE